MASPGDESQAPLDSEVTQAAPGTARSKEQIGPYKLLQLVGEGGLGEVWLAEQTRPVHRQVALKVIKAGMDTAQVVARFEAERQALALMDHPAIARVFDAGATPQGRPYFVMEYVRGESITSYATRRSLSIPDRINLFVQICEGVQHAHQKGIIHRDLKPSNILVTLQNDRPVPKIIDFGVAKAMTQSLTERTLYTELGALVGTPEYMSPEQAEMSGLDIDTRTDVYALGVVLYELLTGALPFDAKSLREKGLDGIRRTIREVDPPKPSTKVTTSADPVGRSTSSGDAARIASQLRGDLDWITMKALEKDRTRRYATVGELAADLQRHLDNQPVLASPPSSLYRVQKFARRNRLAVTAAATFIVLLVAFAATMALQTRRISHERDRANQEAQRANREALTAKQVSDFMVGLFKVSDPTVAKGNTLTAREILDGGVKQIDTALTGQPETRARLEATMGQVYSSLGLYAEAEALLRRALEIANRSLGPDHPTTLRSSSELAYLLSREGRNNEAERLLTDAAYRYERILGPNHRDTLEARARLAFVYRRLGQLVKAEELFVNVTARERQTLGADDSQTLADLANLSIVYDDQGRSLEAVKIGTEVLETRRRICEDCLPTVVAMATLASLDRGLGRNEEARALLDRAIPLAEKILGPTHPRTAIYIQTLGEVALATGDYEAAERHLLRARSIYDLQPAHEYMGLVLYELAEVAARRGHDAQALDLLGLALAKGYKYGKTSSGFANDPHLASLSGNPRFRTMVQASGRAQPQ
jgi:eukaryotic-like serine/threonine-protein kinase